MTFISDGDSKSYPDVDADQPYGEDVEIVKSDCIGHVQKRLGVALRKKKSVDIILYVMAKPLVDGAGLQTSS